MANYRMIAQVPDHRDLSERLEEQIYAWVRSKKLDADSIESGQVTELGAAQAIWLTEEHQDGSSVGRFRLRESRGWLTTVTAEFPGNDRNAAQLWMEVDGPRRDDFSAVPRLARNLLTCVDGFDSRARLTPEPTLVRPEEVDELIDVLCDPDRRGVTFVAGSALGLPFNAWRTLIDDVLKQTVGSSSSYLLDERATELLAEQIGERHAVPPGTIRTYKPALDPASYLDARRHRILGTQRLVDDRPAYLAKLLSGVAREQQLAEPLPRHLTRLSTRLAKAENDLLTRSAFTVSAPVATVPPSGPSSPERSGDGPRGTSVPSSREGGPHEPTPTRTPSRASETAPTFLGALSEGVRDLFQDALDSTTVQALLRLARYGRAAEAHLPALEARLEELTTELEAAIEQRDDRFAQVDDLELALAEEAEKSLKSADRVRYLQRRLEESGQGEAAWSEVPASERTEVPEDYETLIGAVNDLEWVEFTGDSDVLLSLQDHDPLGNWTRKTWEALLALDGYAEAKHAGFAGSFHNYLTSAETEGPKIAVNRYKASESETVSKKWRSEREFPVPPGVDPTGRVYMDSHISIALKRSTSPRLHFHDATGNDGRVYVGYIGPHLTNTQT